MDRIQLGLMPGTADRNPCMPCRVSRWLADVQEATDTQGLRPKSGESQRRMSKTIKDRVIWGHEGNSGCIYKIEGQPKHSPLTADVCCARSQRKASLLLIHTKT
jgi:hypothetical protein